MRKLILFVLVIFQLFLSCGKQSDNLIENKTEITEQELMDICVKFFYFRSPGGQTICKSENKNGISGTIENSNKDVESFCIYCLFYNIEYTVDIFDKELENINKISLGLDENERTLRTQGAIYYAVSHNKKLIKLLKRHYRKKRTDLLFKVKEWERGYL